MKKKVLFIALDGEITGANLSMITLAEKIRKFDIESRVIIPRIEGLEKLLQEKNIPYDVINSYPWIKNQNNGLVLNFVKMCIKKAINYKADMKIKSIIQENHIDILHINGIGYGVGAKAALKSNIKLVWHIREMLEEDFHEELYNKKYSYNILGKADKIITISECVMEKYKKLISSENIVKIYNGVATEQYFSKQRKLFAERKVKLMYAGTLSEAKGIMELIEAIHLLKEEVKEKIQVVAIGKASEEYRQVLEQKIQEYGLSSIITLQGFVENVAEEWKKADIACVCSRFEAFGRVTVEAMMAGCLVIGANVGGTVEIIEDNKSGLLYQKGKPIDLTEKIEYAVHNKEIAKKLASSGQVRAVEKFSEDRNTKEIYEVYHSLVDK